MDGLPQHDLRNGVYLHSDLVHHTGNVEESFVLIYTSKSTGLPFLVSHAEIPSSVSMAATSTSFLYQENARILDFLLAVTPNGLFVSSMNTSFRADLTHAFPHDYDLWAWIYFTELFEIPYERLRAERTLDAFLRMKKMFLSWFCPRREHFVEVLRAAFNQPINHVDLLRTILVSDARLKENLCATTGIPEGRSLLKNPPQYTEKVPPIQVFVAAVSISFALPTFSLPVLVVLRSHSDIIDVINHSYTRVATSKCTGVLLRVFTDVPIVLPTKDCKMVDVPEEVRALQCFSDDTQYAKAASIHAIHTAWDAEERCSFEHRHRHICRKIHKEAPHDYCSLEDRTSLQTIVGTVASSQDFCVSDWFRSLSNLRSYGVAPRPYIVLTSLNDTDSIKTLRKGCSFSRELHIHRL